MTLNFDASPGLGYFQAYASIGQALGWDGITCRNTGNVALLKELVRQKLEGDLMAAPHDLRVFIKDEPHKPKKIQTGAYRLIMVMSLEDQMVDRLLMISWSETEIANCAHIPGKTGWTPIPAGYRLFNAEFPGDVLATDCSAFDWTFPSWVPPLLVKLRLDQVPDASARYKMLVENRWKQVLRDAVIRLPNGDRYRQEGYGLMKSGWYRTIAENSAAQVLINSLAWKRSGLPGLMPRIWTMGDDVLLGWNQKWDSRKLEDALATTGVLVKQSTTTREFGGFEISLQGHVTPLYRDKHAFMLSHVNPAIKSAIADSYTCLYAVAKPGFADVVREKVTPHSSLTWRLAELWARGVVSARC
uniref:RNA-directed RNA polymerase n=1 Tax=Kalotermes flavicollis sobeli-like virus 1 TaxID=3133512 RepID=A0AAT9JF98_9VIRU